ncbi:MAG TPA: hypothetical protein VFQ53_30565 [Kofleriaceae bacterium]|nr:hypothetical protein [Kofleriaceae bacterium]
MGESSCRPVLVMLALAACGSEQPRAPAPATPTTPTSDAIAPSPQRAGDPKRGWDALVGKAYVGCGVPRALWDRFGFRAPPGARVERTQGAELPYFLNAAQLPNGTEIVTANCLGCHAAFLRGKLVVGLGEVSTDFSLDVSNQLAMASMLVGDRDRAELGKLAGRMRALAPYTQTRTIGANPADHIAAVLFAHRDPKTLAWSDEPRIPLVAEPVIPIDVPAWWLLKRKTAMFHTGAGRGDQARIMMTASVLCVDDVQTAREIDAYFPDVRAFLLSLEPPPYPGTIDRERAVRGKLVYDASCRSCHGQGADHRSRVVPLAKIGTDPMLASRAGQFAAPFTEWFNQSFYGEVAHLDPGAGYVAPPLDGVWATAPYFHNGSAPNLAAVLDSSQRLPRTAIVRGPDAYDLESVGWPNRPAGEGDDPKWVYDAAQPGYANTGHRFGDKLTADDRAAVLEYLKTL